MSVSVWIYHSPVGERRHPRATLRERSGTEAGEYSEGIQRISLMLWQNSNGGFRREGEAPAEPRLRRSVALPKENPDDCPPPASPHFQRPSLALPTRETRLDRALGSEEMAAADRSGFVGDRLLLFTGRFRQGRQVRTPRGLFRSLVVRQSPLGLSREGTTVMNKVD